MQNFSSTLLNMATDTLWYVI